MFLNCIKIGNIKIKLSMAFAYQAEHYNKFLRNIKNKSRVGVASGPCSPRDFITNVISGTIKQDGNKYCQ